MREQLIKPKRNNLLQGNSNSQSGLAMSNGRLRLNPSNVYNAANIINNAPQRRNNIYDTHNYRYDDETRIGYHMRNMSKRITLKTGDFDFNKRAYRNDEELKKIRTLIDVYNASGSVQSEINLMKAANDYIMKNTLGTLEDEGGSFSLKKIRHRGRMKMMEDILYQLTMRGGATADAATDNIGRLKGRISSTGFSDSAQKVAINQETQTIYKGKLRNTMEEIKNLYKNGKYSKTMQMIAADVMSRQFKTDTLHATGFSDSKVDTRSRKNVVNVKVNPDDQTARTPEAKSRFMLGTGLHEFTHMAVQDAYRNSDLPVAFTNFESTENIVKEMNRRRKLLGKLSVETYKDFGGKKAPKNWTEIANYAMGRASYGMNNGGNDYYLKSFLTKNTDLQQENQNNPEFLQFLQSERSRLDRIGRVFRAANKNGTVEDFSNTMVEYEAVVPQMLAEYEYAGVNRKSDAYQKLKAVALDSHVRRRIADLINKQYYKNR